ncbi:hypothetical protein CAEBREN_18273 [Caenorhabditis brenneri]|uniref:Reticulon-like protein n=1 Tax=Caenorhabditis brenneri TaxID=135651 RepID=G0MQ37_CAEBE|nr:hypothetical protein CAEBREN_18273 [Caenorhabditis brenneri]
MTHLQTGRAAGAVMAEVIKFLIFLWPYRLQILLLAEIVVIVLGVYRITRASGILKNKKVADIVFWRDVKMAGMVFASFSIALPIICKYSIISVITATLILISAAAVTYCEYKIMTGTPCTENPFSEIITKYSLYLQEMVPSLADSCVENTIWICKSLLKLVLLENSRKSCEFVLFLTALKHMVRRCAEFPFITMVVCFGASIIPRIYKDNQHIIDPLLAKCSEYIAAYCRLFEDVKKRENKRSRRRVPVAAE